MNKQEELQASEVEIIYRIQNACIGTRADQTFCRCIPAAMEVLEQGHHRTPRRVQDLASE